jgi:hypothetical protein
VKLIFILGFFLLFCFASLILIIIGKNKGMILTLFFSIMVMVITLNLSPALLSINSVNVEIQLLFFLLISLNMTLLIYNSMRKESLSKLEESTFNTGKMSILLCVIVGFLILQSLEVELFDVNLFTAQFITYCNLLLMVLLFGQINYFKYSYIPFLKIITYFSLYNSILSIFQYIYNKPFLLFLSTESITYNEGIEAIKRVMGVVGSNNGAGNLGAILFPILLYNFLRKKSLLNFLVLILNCIFVALTLTRIAYGAIFCEILIILLMHKSKSYKSIGYKVVLTIVSFLFLIIITSLFYSEIVETLFVSRGDTGAHRYMQFTYVFKLAIENLLIGVGAGQYTYYVLYYYGFSDLVVHSQLLNMFVEQGFISLICFIIFNVFLFCSALRKIDKEYRWLPIALFIGNLVTSNFNPNQNYYINIYIYIYLMLSIIYSREELKSKTSKL